MNTYLIIGVVAFTTMFIRFCPFFIFKKTSKLIDYLGDVLPFSIMAMLVVYCLKDISFISYNTYIPKIAATIITIVVHKFKHNILLSIIVGTIVYMFLMNTL